MQVGETLYNPDDLLKRNIVTFVICPKTGLDWKSHLIWGTDSLRLRTQRQQQEQQNVQKEETGVSNNN